MVLQCINGVRFVDLSRWQPYNISVPLDLKVTCDTRLILNIIYVWKLNQTVLEVTLRLLKLYFNIADVVEWSRALDIRLNDWCCSVSMVWVQIPSRGEQNLTAQKSNSNTLWFNFQTYYKRQMVCKTTPSTQNKVIKN
jgi:hypothetical protein